MKYFLVGEQIKNFIIVQMNCTKELEGEEMDLQNWGHTDLAAVRTE